MKGIRFFILLIMAFFYQLQAFAIEIVIFDWDSNVAFMKTPHKIFHKETNEKVTLRGEVFDKYYNDIGVRGIYEDFEKRDIPGGTYKYTTIGPNGENYLNETIVRFLNDPYDISWKAPMWDFFAERCSSPTRAKRTLIVTSRMAPPEQIYETLQSLSDAGILKYPIPVENIWPTNYSKFPEIFEKRLGTPFPHHLNLDLGDRKALVIKGIIDNSPAEASIHLKFSDDSRGNIEKVAKAFYDESFDPRNSFYFHQTKPHNLTQTGVESFRLVNGERVPLPFLKFTDGLRIQEPPCFITLYQMIGVSPK